MFRSLPCLPLLKHLHDIHVLNAKLGRCCTLTLLPCDGCRVAQNSPVRYGSDLLLPFLQNAGPNGVRWTAILAQVEYRLLRQEIFILNKLVLASCGLFFANMQPLNEIVNTDTLCMAIKQACGTCRFFLQRTQLCQQQSSASAWSFACQCS